MKSPVKSFLYFIASMFFFASSLFLFIVAIMFGTRYDPRWLFLFIPAFIFTALGLFLWQIVVHSSLGERRPLIES